MSVALINVQYTVIAGNKKFDKYVSQVFAAHIAMLRVSSMISVCFSTEAEGCGLCLQNNKALLFFDN